MNPVDFKGRTILLGAPKGTPPGECESLPVRITPVPGGTYGAQIQSYWKPDPGELAALIAGGHVRLTVHGAGHPPVWLDVERCEELP